ncbi:MAG TPA: ribonuclease R [Nevskiaceae bacterium]|nr:ribonuclease R [Nevskiaceae bacterium]
MKKGRASRHPSRPPAGGDWTQSDPAFGEESGRYEDPVPSRTFILETLAAEAGPMTLDELIGRFQLAKLSQQTALDKRLAAMLRDGQVVQNRRGAYGPVGRMNAIAGVVQAHRDGFGFLIRDEGGPDIFLPARQMRSLMNGDRVLVRISGTDFKGRPEGSLVEVLERGSRTVVGRLHVEQGVAYVIPDNPRVQQDLLIPADQQAGARHGQMVVAEITAPPGNRTLPVGRVTEVLGEHLAPGMEILASIRAHNLPYEWPPEVEDEAAELPETVGPAEIGGREDLRELPLVTIDGADARDFDDAVHARRRRGGGWTLWVAIADVAAYVKPGSALDVEALNRGNSVYFPQQVIPMLPEKLSNGLCSLNPRVDRLCMVCEMQVQADGEIAKSRFYEAVMCSKARLTYDEVAQVLDQPEGETAQRLGALVSPLQVLAEVYQALFAAREQRGAIDFESSETRIVFNAERKIEKVVPVTRNRAHRLIEECMIAANVQAALLVAKRKCPAPYRIHETPDAAKVQVLREFLALRGLKLSGGETPEASDYARITAAARGRPDERLIQTVLLRSLMQARYSADNAGHFGLALTHYAHFTSPIRRYPDLLLHRALKHLILGKKVSTFGYSVDDIDRHGAHCSMTERRADEATREVVAWLKCEAMRDKVGEAYEGLVTGVAAFGLFVELQGLYIEGLVHVSNLRNDYYQYEAHHHRLIGDNSGRVYQLGDRLRVRVVRVNLDERKIDLEPIEEAGGARRDSSERVQPQRQDSRGRKGQGSAPRPGHHHQPRGKKR